jgi:hypothetical protein
LVMLFGFALIGHLNFGSQIRDRSQGGRSRRKLYCAGSAFQGHARDWHRVEGVERSSDFCD